MDYLAAVKLNRLVSAGVSETPKIQRLPSATITNTMSMTQDILQIDGSQGEGGGQMLRSSLALSMVTGKSVRLVNIRAGRKKPGLKRQHLTAVRAAAQIAGAHVTGDELGAMEVKFVPSIAARDLGGATHHFSVGTAGSSTLVLQTVLPALLLADAPTQLRLEGGTHNPFAPPFDFLVKAFLPLVNRMGPTVTANLERPGFFPAGGGVFTVDIQPAIGSTKLTPFDLLERGAITARRATATLAHLPTDIAERELSVVAQQLNWSPDELHVQTFDAVDGAETSLASGIQPSAGPGNLLTLEVQSEQVCEVFTGFGARNLAAEKVAREAIRPCRDYLAGTAPVGEYLAEQILLPLAIAGGGRYHATTLSSHTTTHIDIVQRFLDCHINVERRGREGAVIAIES